MLTIKLKFLQPEATRYQLKLMDPLECIFVHIF